MEDYSIRINNAVYEISRVFSDRGSLLEILQSEIKKELGSDTDPR